ncbi:MAG: type I-F CRISPR-associated protein Csy2, partial [Deltaproteobacteria bacterium]|nr:type I-F CRISPR-associated protein Csy2 [Deltaproteobacteria bacterium]
MNSPEAILLLPRLRIQNANAISSHMTWGFPSPTAFTGFVNALQRRVGTELGLIFDGVAIVSHRFDPQISQPNGRRHNVFKLTRNPVSKNGSVASIVEEGRAHLDVSLLVGVTGDGLYTGQDP